MNSKIDARLGNLAKKNADGNFDIAMCYGWASSEAAWEKIISRASWSLADARAALQLIRLMEVAGVADLPKAAQNMRNAARVANKTIRENTMRLVFPNKVLGRQLR